jgi:hypothetical protein
MSVKLFDYQKEALSKIKNGSILCGGVGSGKSITSLAYYHVSCRGKLDPFEKMENPINLYIITTARKRDTEEWDKELIPFFLSSGNKIYDIDVTIDSWNNIKKYSKVKNSFFIFDEQRVVGWGVWAKSFIEIARNNKWILLSATPGDTWMDYLAVFIANGFFKNKTEFIRNHVIYSRYTKYPKVESYIHDRRLQRLRDSILVNMNFNRKTIQNHIHVLCEFDKQLYKETLKNRWDIFKDAPITSASELCSCLRKISNASEDRLNKIMDILNAKKKAIIFYNFDYELDLLKDTLDFYNYEYAEWNGHKHQPIPESNEWAYLVQYTAGAEGWNCIKTDTVIFFSPNYSYKIMVQSAGRIDRLNTPYKNLYFYHLKTTSGIDIAIQKALNSKKKFNENKFTKGYF